MNLLDAMVDQVGLKDNEVTLPFGKMGEQPYNVTAKDVPLSHLVIRTPDTNAPPPRGGMRTRPTPQAVIDHICYTVADFNRNRAKAALIAMDVHAALGMAIYTGRLNLDELAGLTV